MSARRSAYASLSQRVESYPELHRHDIDRTGLDPRDARLAIAIDHQATLRWLSLQAIIEPHLKQSWTGLKPVVRAALLGGGGSCYSWIESPITRFCMRPSNGSSPAANPEPRDWSTRSCARMRCPQGTDRGRRPGPQGRASEVRWFGNRTGQTTARCRRGSPDRTAIQLPLHPDGSLDKALRKRGGSKTRGSTESPMHR